MKKIAALVFLIISIEAVARDPYPKNDAIDIIHYTFQLEVNDSTDVLLGEATVTVLFNKSVSEFELDLVNQNSRGQGMLIKQITANGAKLRFTHQHERVKISLSTSAKSQTQLEIVISYEGIPQDGLTIGKNKFGDRGFYGDNWPDRGHHWLPVVDHPSDKAAVDFIVIAPLHYSVVANGVRVEESFLDSRRKLTHWREEVPIAVKVMVVGIARFAVQYVGKVDDIGVESWVYPQNKNEGFYDYAVAVKVLDYFHHHIGPYSYKKLANVQSKTRWGGLENANTIFYDERLINGKGAQEPIIAHEEAHQWFGNSASEKDWYHVWLSEGFATYFSHLYLEYAYGHDRLVEEQKVDRAQVIEYLKKNPAPIVDTTRRELNSILNINTYQKAGWVLHMLRHQLGDAIFWKGIQDYYRIYRNSNALTADFQRVMEEASGANLSSFFDQWIYKGGHPKLRGKYVYDKAARAVKVTLSQLQTGSRFKTPVELDFSWDQGRHETKTVMLDGSPSQEFTLPVTEEPLFLMLDPGTWLLFEGEIERG